MVVVPDRDGQREESLEDPDEDALLAVAAVAFQAELAFQRVEDRLDDLADRFQLLRAGPFPLAFERGSDESDAAFSEADQPHTAPAPLPLEFSHLAGVYDARTSPNR